MSRAALEVAAVWCGGAVIFASMVCLWLRQEKRERAAEREYRRVLLRAMAEGAGAPPLRVVRGGQP